MSLLNDMLRDLDQQRGAGNRTPSEPIIATAVPRKVALKHWWLPVTALLAVGYFVVAEKNLLGFSPSPQQNYLEVPKPSSVNSEWLAEMEQQEQRSVAAKLALANENAVPFMGNSSPDEPANKPREVSGAPVSDGHSLTNNLEAGGLEGDAHSGVYPVVALPTAANSPQLAAPPPTVNAETGSRTLPDVDANPLPANSRPATEAISAAPAPTTSLVRAASATAQIPRSPPPAPRVTLSPEDRDYSIARDLNANTLALREDAAWVWLREGAVIDQTAFALADLYRARSHFGKLQDLRDLLAHRAPNLVPYVLAQQALLEQDWPAAIRALGNARFQGPAEAQRLRLLGGIYQNTQQYPQALDVYSQLVGRRDAQVNDWLGQAVALDALGNRQGARDAYRRVHQMQHPDPQVNTYAQRREYELSQLSLSR